MLPTIPTSSTGTGCLEPIVKEDPLPSVAAVDLQFPSECSIEEQRAVFFVLLSRPASHEA